MSHAYPPDLSPATPLSPNALRPVSRNSIAAFLQGVRLPFRALGFLIARPLLWPLVALPLAINILLFVALTAWGFSEFADILRGWIASNDAWYWTAFAWIAKFLFWAVVLFVIYFIFTPMALLIASPFNDMLAESVERAFGFSVRQKRPFLKAILGDLGYVLLSESKRLLVAMGVFVLLTPLNLLPIIGNILYLTLGFIWLCWCAALEFSGYTADRRHLRLRRKWRGLAGRNFPASMGFGLVTVGLMSIPFLNTLMAPIGAVAGAMLFGMAEQNLSDDSLSTDSWRSE